MNLHRDNLHHLERDKPGLILMIDLARIYAAARRIAGKSIQKHNGMPIWTLPAPFTIDQIKLDGGIPIRQTENTSRKVCPRELSIFP